MADPTPTAEQHSKHDREDGGHSSAVVSVEVSTGGKEGRVTLYICTTCHYITASCEHAVNAWNDDGTTLSCQLCGIDGT